jgi:hypothetical protein
LTLDGLKSFTLFVDWSGRDFFKIGLGCCELTGRDDELAARASGELRLSVFLGETDLSNLCALTHDYWITSVS